MLAFSCPCRSRCCRSIAHPFASARPRTSDPSRLTIFPSERCRRHQDHGRRRISIYKALAHLARAAERQSEKAHQKPAQPSELHVHTTASFVPSLNMLPNRPSRHRRQPSQRSKRIPERKRSIAAVKILQLNRCETERAGGSCFVVAVIIPGHFVAEAAIDSELQRSIGPLIVEVQRAGRRQLIQKNSVAAHKAAAVTHARRHTLRRLPNHRRVSEIIFAVVSRKRPQWRRRSRDRARRATRKLRHTGRKRGHRNSGWRRRGIRGSSRIREADQ